MKKILLTGIAVLLVGTTQAQMGAMAALNSGSIESLDQVTRVNIVYDYSEVSVGAYRQEQDYLDKKCKEITEKKGAAECERFKKGWFDARKQSFEPMFEELFRKYAPEDIGMDGNNYDTKNPYTLLVKTVAVEPGFNVGMARRPAFIDLECTFKDKNGKELCTFFIKNAYGAQVMGMDYDVSSRLKESYAKAAKMLVGCIAKERKKAGRG